MTALAEPDYFEDYDEDYRSDIASRYEEGFGQGPEIDDDYDSGYDELDKLFDGLYDDDDDGFDAPAKAKTPAKQAAPKAATKTAAKASTPKKASSKSMPKAGPVITRRVVPVAAVVEEATPVEAAPAEAVEAAAVEGPAVVAEAPAVAVEAPVAEATAPEAPVAAQPAAAEPTPAATASVAVVEAKAAEEPEEAPALPEDPFFHPHIAPVNEHVEFLRKLRPGFEVPYVDPMHSVEDCRIVTLFSNTSEASPRGTVWAGDDAAATRLLGLQFQLGLRPEWMMPWNTHPWFTPGEANGKLTPEQVSAGLKPLITFLKLVPRASAIVAHGTEANRLAQMLLKTDNQLIWRRGLKVYKARSLHGRAFAGSKERQTEWLIEMGRSYADAMARAGLQAGRR
ncbi:hypothetical protein SAMN05216555_1044 [Arthrobacter cupressi]|uniref:Uracil DNA glycosylase superfamily protein n=2 Tax=Arthrobacter cupressi TaxID=1045773 RepID=A0A1G8MQ49_9MICC|nr:hypothetical protein [Arthrobacter cupressi]SDI70178.1 hypothetical protein SAMN05216555_1044 [Arthrobacter cupressi]